MNKQKIIEELQAGNQEGLTFIYQRYAGEFIGFVSKKYRIDRDQARDFYIESIIEFRRNVVNGKLLELKSSLKTYLFTIGRNQILNYLRDNKLTYVEEMKDNLNHSDTSHQIVMEKEERMKAVQIIFQQLPENCYKLLKLFYFDHMNTKQIQIQMNYQNEQTVRTRKYKCSQKLKQLFVEQNVMDY
jgi:RNA polymerase sigma factor (sigma-70 family)